MVVYFDVNEQAGHGQNTGAGPVCCYANQSVICHIQLIISSLIDTRIVCKVRTYVFFVFFSCFCFFVFGTAVMYTGRLICFSVAKEGGST